METWEDLIKTLPSDETLERKEKSGELRDFDRKLNLLEDEINNLKAKMKQDDKEIEEMFKELNIPLEKQSRTK